jgi:hypothetical protein
MMIVALVVLGLIKDQILGKFGFEEDIEHFLVSKASRRRLLDEKKADLLEYLIASIPQDFSQTSPWK